MYMIGDTNTGQYYTCLVCPFSLWSQIDWQKDNIPTYRH